MDKYTKAVLTVIAVCLVIQTGNVVLPKAHAFDTLDEIGLRNMWREDMKTMAKGLIKVIERECR